MSSRITNVVSTVFQSQPGNTLAVIGQIRGGITSIGRAAVQTNRETGALHQQMRAFSTTMRYALAGAGVYGAMGLVKTLRDTQRQLALIAALGAFDRVITDSGKADKAVADLYQSAQVGAMNALTPVGDFNEALVNLYSTIGQLGPQHADAAITMVTEISKGAQLAQVPVEDLTRSVTGMNQAFQRPQNIGNVSQLVRGFYGLTQAAPGAAAFGPQFVQQLSPLASVSSLARLSPEQMMGIYLTRLQVGSTPAVAGRGLQYLLQSIAVPPSPEAAKALAQAGVTPETVQAEGGMVAIERIIAHVRKMGPSDTARIRGLSEDQLDLLETTADPAGAMASLGISGKGAEWMTQAIGRIHGVRALIDLMAQDPAEDVAEIHKYMGDTVEAQNAWKNAWANFARRQPLQAAVVALDNIRRDIATAIEPAVNYVAEKVSQDVYPFLEEHPGGVKRVTQGVVAGGGLLALIRAAGFGTGVMGRIGGGFNKLGNTAVAAQAFRAAEAGAQPGLSPLNPLYVVVVGQIFGPTGGGGPGPDVPPGGKNWLRKLGGWGVAGAVIAGRKGVAGLERAGLGALGMATRAPWLLRGAPIAGGVLEALMNPETAGTVGAAVRPMAGERWGQNFRRARQAFPNQNIIDLFGTKEHKNYVEVDVLIRHPDGRLERQRGKHVPKPRWERGNIPNSRGRPGG